MNWIRKNRLKFTIIAMLLFLLISIGNTAQGRATATSGEGLFRKLTYPIERVLYISSQYVKNVYDFVVELPSLRARYEDINSELQESQMKLANYDKLVQENEELLSLLDYTQGNKEYDFIPASVVSIDPYRGFRVFVIDKGSKDGIEKNMTVVLNEGLVGRILETSQSTSKVLSIIDSTSMFNGMSAKTRDYVRITGVEDHKLKGYSSQDAVIEEGDTIVTSGLSGVFEKDILVGTVEEIVDQPGRMEKVLIIEPTVEIEKINRVLIIK